MTEAALDLDFPGGMNHQGTKTQSSKICEGNGCSLGG